MTLNLLNLIRNFAIAHFLSGFSLFLLGWSVGLPPWVVFGVPVVCYSLALFLSWGIFGQLTFGSLWQALKDFPKLPLGIILFFLLLNTLFCLLPPSEHTEMDALNYHLTIPWQYYLRGGVVPLDWSVADKYPLYLQMAQLPFTVLSFPWIVKTANLATLPALLIVSLNWIRLMDVPKKEVGFFVALICSLALFTKQYGTAMLDLTNTVYILLGFLYLIRAERSGKIADLIFGSLLLGMACALKTFYIYHAIVWFLALLFWKRFLHSKRLSYFDYSLALLPMIVGIIFLLPVWVRNIVHVGNPFFPALLDFFGTFVEYEKARTLQQQVYTFFGYGHSLIDFLLLPVRLILPIPRKFDYWTDPILLFFLLGSVMALRQRWRALPGLVQGISLLLYTVFFFTSQQARFLYAFWILIIAVGGVWIVQKINKKVFVTLLIGQFLVGTASFFFFHRDIFQPLRYWSKEGYLENASYSYVWNQSLKDKNIQQLCLMFVGDILYFEVPVKLIQHYNSTLVLNEGAIKGCDVFMSGERDAFKKVNALENRGQLISADEFLCGTTGKAKDDPILKTEFCLALTRKKSL